MLLRHRVIVRPLFRQIGENRFGSMKMPGLDGRLCRGLQNSLKDRARIAKSRLIFSARFKPPSQRNDDGPFYGNCFRGGT